MTIINVYILKVGKWKIIYKDYYTEEQATLLDKLHKQKIDMSDSIFVVNVNGYIGNSTKSEIEYAKATNKEILYLERI